MGDDVPMIKTFTATYSIMFDPPDGDLGWFVEVRWDSDGKFYDATRYGPIPFDKVEQVRDELKARDERMITHLKETFRRGPTPNTL